jgi:NAD(P)H-hydrate epimerase
MQANPAMNAASHPILTSEEAALFEKDLFAGNDSAEWNAMREAGQSVASAVLRDSEEIGGFSKSPRLLVLAGKGHNAGDALIAARDILEKLPQASADVVFVFGERSLRPLAQRAWRELMETANGRVKPRSGVRSSSLKTFFERNRCYDLSLDGVFGYQFRPPLSEETAAVLRQANSLSVRFRAAVDLPSGLNESGAFQADFTYATGIVKSHLLTCANAGRLRYLDIGFFESEEERTLSAAVLPDPHPAGGPAEKHDGDRVLIPRILAPLRRFRSSETDKRDYGHLVILGGSHSYPGAVLMSVLSALKSGVGLVTAVVPESLVASYAARAPEAMWVGWPQGSGPGLALGGLPLLTQRWGRATALLAGPGLGRDPSTHETLAQIVKTAPMPLVLDADALQPDLVRDIRVPRILTPHIGEFARIARGADFRSFRAETGATVVLKGPVTCIASPTSPVYHSFFGGPVLARGGSGDVLAGLIAGLFAQSPMDPVVAACQGAVWHGLAADSLARAQGQTSVRITELIDHLPTVLRNEL